MENLGRYYTMRTTVIDLTFVERRPVPGSPWRGYSKIL